MKRRFDLNVCFNEKEDLVQCLKRIVEEEVEKGVDSLGIMPIGRCIACYDIRDEESSDEVHAD